MFALWRKGNSAHHRKVIVGNNKRYLKVRLDLRNLEEAEIKIGKKTT
jgi:hypothetical protein